MKTVYACPKCKGALYRQDRCYRCENGHSFDLSKEGYVNLLMGKGSGTHGDNREMLLARQAFLSYGYYRRMADTVSGFLRKFGVLNGECRLLDIGCGEGYYTRIFRDALQEMGAEVYAFDISREAVKLAAKRSGKGEEQVSLSVASAYHMPYLDSSFTIATNLFSPLAPEEVARVLRDGGHFVMVIPEKEHLFGLKSAIYDTPYKNEVMPFDLVGFALVHDERLRYTVTLNHDETIVLFGMTPYAYRTSSVGRERIHSLDTLTTDIDFHILVYKKA
ncbi:MAG: methyltransferase domain-containing protein [Clostridia bacterium]|nr:methyltransferase domain-containing protein [Clostridia bacterium]